MHNEMKGEYDFSNATRGKFYRAEAQLFPPIHLDPEVLNPSKSALVNARSEAQTT